MVNYTNSKVYKIWSTQNNKIYVGSTTKQYLSQRMDVHRSQYKRWKDGKFNYITSFLIFEECGLENCFIELLEAKECKSKDELHRLEGKYIRELDCENKMIAGRTQKEYHEDHKEIISEYQKQYHEVNKEKLSVYRKQKINCECGGIYVYSNKSQHFKTINHCKFIESKITKPEDDEV